jgi:hypothetical protein
VRGFWLVGLSDKRNAEANDARTQSLFIDVATGDVTRR